MFLFYISDLKLGPVHQKMPKPKSPERPPKRKVEPKTKASSVKSVKPSPRKVAPKIAQAPRESFPESAPIHANVTDQLSADVEAVQLEDVPLDNPRPERIDHNKVEHKVYPALIRELLSVCVGEASDVRGAFKNRNRQKYKNIFDSYKDKLSQRDYSIVKGALFYLYDFSRVNSIDKDTALWMLGIYEIPTSQIISYTSKEVLKSIAKDHGLSYSNKKAEDLVESIRGVIDPSQ